MRNQKTSLNDKNLLAGITPTKSGWVTNPLTDAELASELIASNSTQGHVAAGGATGVLIYDLGRSQRIVVVLKTNLTTNLTSVRILGSEDNISYYELAKFATGATGIENYCTALAKMRYVRFEINNSSAGEVSFNTRCTAYQLGGL